MLSEMLKLDSDFEPDEVLSRIAVDVRDWHESRLSNAARKQGIYGFGYRIRGPRVKVWARGNGLNSFASLFDGAVVARGTGSQIRGRFRVARFGLAALSVWCVALLCVTGFGIRQVLVVPPSSGDAAGEVGAIIGGALLLFAFVPLHLTTGWRRGHLPRGEIRALLGRAAGVEPLPRPLATTP